MASRTASASKNTQQRMFLKSGGGGDSRSNQKRRLEPDTLVSLQTKPEHTPSSTSMLMMEAGVPPRSDSSLSQRVGTPTKRVSLTAVKRKEESERPIEPELDWRAFTRSNSSLRFGVRSNSQTSFSPSNAAEEASSRGAESSESGVSQASESGYSSKADTVTDAEVGSRMQAASLRSGENVDKPAEDKSSSSDDDSDSEEEVRKAPNELFMEFLDCLMKKDYLNAEKLCRMILIYEPKNPEALKFHPVILEKLELGKYTAEGYLGDSSDTDSDDAIIEENEGPPRPDSGIGM
ncbi:hypothetical protein BaRGS_00011223 [Batillaria attramentaria]|uniref:Glutamate-rich protein 2 n=1 Tax=Batillaria attramentaria TaxID=370345 RepID=A0ABD0LED3_9CAEN